MNKIQKAFVWSGRICTGLGIILMMISVIWRWKYNITGEGYVGSIPFKIFWIGALPLFAGLCTLAIIRKANK